MKKSILAILVMTLFAAPGIAQTLNPSDDINVIGETKESNNPDHLEAEATDCRLNGNCAKDFTNTTPYQVCDSPETIKIILSGESTEYKEGCKVNGKDRGTGTRDSTR